MHAVSALQVYHMLGHRLISWSVCMYNMSYRIA